jgi:hypothetical protein
MTKWRSRTEKALHHINRSLAAEGPGWLDLCIAYRHLEAAEHAIAAARADLISRKTVQTGIASVFVADGSIIVGNRKR